MGPLAPPGAPTNVQASAGNGQATITFTPPANAATTAVSSYTVTASPGAATATTGGSPVTVTGLTNGTAYTFTVHATNAAGNGPESAPSAPVTPATDQIPSPPLLPRATPGNQQATVSFTTSLSDGGSPITSYTVTATPGGQTATGPASPITVTGLTNGTTYTFTVVATNAAGGTSQPSTPSTPVTPGAGQANNDLFANAQPISGESGTIIGSNVNATKEPGEPNHNHDPGGASIWYWWTGPSGAVTFDTCGSSFPTVIGVYQGSAVTALTPINIERGIQPCGDGTSAPSVVFNVAPGGDTFQIAVDGVNTGTGPATGSVKLNWRHAG